MVQRFDDRLQLVKAMGNPSTRRIVNQLNQTTPIQQRNIQAQEIAVQVQPAPIVNPPTAGPTSNLSKFKPGIRI